MDSLLRPVGPSSRAVYWRRRVVLAVLFVLASYFIVKACSTIANGDDAEPTGQSTLQSPPVTEPAPGAESTGDQPTSPSGGTGEPPHEPSATGEATQVSGGGGGTVPGYCSDDNIRLDVRPDKREYAPRTEPTFTLLVINVGEAPCKFDVGTAGWAIEIKTGETLIWSSEHCATEQVKDVQTLDRLVPVSIQIRWNRMRSEEGCPTGAAPADPGTYTVTATAGGVTSPPAVFVLN